ncbi:glycosyltransferase [Ekhidna sp.]|uniref:glycosyltransferase n=1 Tax=Ekhidna sp. TaxID=2608089 RepID=UPI003C799771
MIFGLWLAFGGLHLVLTIYLSVAFRNFKSLKNPNRPKLSVIIAAHNEAENLKKLIPALQSQKYLDFEIIVALDRTTDDSQSYLIGLDRVNSLKIDKIPSDWNAKKYVLTEAIKHATGEWLVFTDADGYPSSKKWLRMMSQQIDNETQIVLGVSPYTSGNSFLFQYISFEAFMTAFLYVSRAISNKPYMGVGRNMMINKAFFNRMGGYESIKSIQGGDDDLFIQQYANKSNTRIVLGNDALIWTYPKSTWKAYFLQKLRHLSIGSKYKDRDLLFLTMLHTTHFGFLLLLFLNTSQLFFWPMLLFYLFIKLVSYRFAASKIGTHINYMLLPLVDMLYAVLTPVIALWSKLVKDIPWKN